jgi:hypothetical protein
MKTLAKSSKTTLKIAALAILSPVLASLLPFFALCWIGYGATRWVGEPVV